MDENYKDAMSAHAARSAKTLLCHQKFDFLKYLLDRTDEQCTIEMLRRHIAMTEYVYQRIYSDSEDE